MALRRRQPAPPRPRTDRSRFAGNAEPESMDRLWTPWRFTYVSRAEPQSPCIFCDKAAAASDAESFVVYRGRHSFVLLNIFPYNNGHMMIAPYEHAATLGETSRDALQEIIELTRLAEKHLLAIYKPLGINIGMNIGECAGAGVAGHIHMHVLPRWPGDAGFMTTVSETRVIPEDLRVSWEKLRAAFQGS